MLKVFLRVLRVLRSTSYFFTSSSAERSVSWFRGFVVFVVLVMSVAVTVAQSAGAGDVTVSASVDRTAMFVGDRATYTIELTCRRGVEILPDDLSGDKLTLEGLELVAAENSRQSGRDGATIYQFRYVVTTYRVDAPKLTIGPTAVRYATTRPGQRLEEAAPAGEVQVPLAAIALRSALPDEADVLDIRRDRSATPRPAVFAMLQPVGIGLVIVSMVPALVAGAAVVRRRRAHLERSPRRSARTLRHEERASLDAVRAMDFSSIDGRRDALTALDSLVRAHLRDVCGIPGPSLTPGEVASALSSHGTRVPVELVTAVLTTCEHARYAPPHASPSADVCREAIGQVEQVIAP
jgi:hypothetical protein